MSLTPDPILSAQQKLVSAGLAPLKRGRDSRGLYDLTPAGKVRVQEALDFLHRFRSVLPANIVADALPISDDDVLAWVRKDEEAREALAWDTAKALAYIDTFGPKMHDRLMCREPSLCDGRGFCPRDPACNN